VLQAMGRGVVYLGPSGSGARMKLINNFVCAAQLAGLAEAVGLIEHGGLDLAKALSVLTQGAPGSPIVKLMADRVTALEYEPNFTVRLMAKDIGYAIGEGKHHGQKLATASTALKIFEEAIAAGRAEEDITSVGELFRAPKKA